MVEDGGSIFVQDSSSVMEVLEHSRKGIAVVPSNVEMSVRAPLQFDVEAIVLAVFSLPL